LFLGHLFPKKTPQFHIEIYQLLNEKRLAIAAPRSFAKSTILSLIYPLWLALFSDKKEDIVITSSTSALAEEWLRRIKNELEMNENLVALVGNQQSNKWANDHIILKNGNQIRAKGRGYQIRGFRPTRVVVDDMEDDEGVRSAEQREYLREWFFKALVNTLEQDSQIIVIGTLLHPASLLSDLLKNEFWMSRIYKALNEKEESLWEDKWPAEALKMRRREIGTLRFEAEYQNNPLAALDGKWKPEWCQWYDNKELADLYVITTIDPAVSQKESADYTAIVTLGLSMEEGKRKRYVLDARQGRWSIKETTEEIIQAWKRYSSQMIWIEEFGFQQALRQYMDAECERQQITLPINRIQLGRGWFKKAKDKVTRLLAVTYLGEQGLVYIKRGQNELYDQLITFPWADHDDLVDSFTYALHASVEVEREGGGVVGTEESGIISDYGMEIEKSFQITDNAMPSEVMFEKPQRGWQNY
jgi:predicted phage terminase large subunit-like protein